MIEEGTETSRVMTATYRKAELPEHRGNPLIEALPPFCVGKERLLTFGKYPTFHKLELDLSPSARMLAISRLDDYLEPLACHETVITKTFLMMYAGYTHRNPATASYRKSLVQFYRQSMEGPLRPIQTSGPATAPAFSLFGVSGVGKSSVVERALSFVPQALSHPSFGFEPQILWLKLDCPLDGSLKQLLKSLVHQVDRVLNTDYSKLTKWAGVDELVILVAKIVAKHHLGILVIDEIQNVLEASGVGAAKMLNFFVTFVNCARIPLFVLGTPKAQRYLGVLFREARRLGDYGSDCWNRMGRGPEWDWFLRKLSRYQWTSKPISLCEAAISEAMYFLTQGIHALVVRLFQLSQQQAIRDGSERLTAGLIRQVATREFVLLEPALEALRSGNRKRIMKYDDFFSHEVAALNSAIEPGDRDAKLKEMNKKAEKQADDEAWLMSNLVELGVDADKARRILEKLESDKAVSEASRQQLLRKITQADLLNPDQSLIQQFKKGKGAKVQGRGNFAKPR